MRTLYVDGDSRLHRLAPGIKLGALALFAAALFLTRAPLPLSIAMLAAAVIYFRLGHSFKAAIAPLRPILLTIAVVALFNLVFTSAEEAMVTVLRLTALALAAASVTATTGIGDFIATITRAAMPLEKLGLLRAADIGLAVGLVIRLVPEIIGRYQAILAAHRARGLRPRPLTVLAPLIILTLKDADSIAAAIDARGIRRQ